MRKTLVFLTSMFIGTIAYAAPSNEQLYQMIVGLKNEIADSKAKASELQVNLDKANTQLVSAKKQLGELPKTSSLVTAIKQLDESAKNKPPMMANLK